MHEATKAKISAAKKAYHPMRGKHSPQEVREKLRSSNIGQKRTEATRHNISEGLKKRWETKRQRKYFAEIEKQNQNQSPLLSSTN